MNTLKQEIQSFLMEKTGITEEQMRNEKTELNDIGVDSLSTFELVFEIEDKFGLGIASEARQIVTVKDVMDAIDEAIAKKLGMAQSAAKLTLSAQ